MFTLQLALFLLALPQSHPDYPERVETIADVLCAETSYSEEEALLVMQVIINRSRHWIFPEDPVAVVLQPKQFATRDQCGEGWMRQYHRDIAARGMFAITFGTNLVEQTLIPDDVLFFLAPHAYSKRKQALQGVWSLTHRTYKQSGRTRHYFFTMDAVYAQRRQNNAERRRRVKLRN